MRKASCLPDLSNGYVTLLEVTENFWRLSRIAKRFILGQKFSATSAESCNRTRNLDVLK